MITVGENRTPVFLALFLAALVAAGYASTRPANRTTGLQLENLEPPEGYVLVLLEALYSGHADTPLERLPKPVMLKVDNPAYEGDPREYHPVKAFDFGGSPRRVVYAFYLPRGVYMLRHGKCILCNWNIEKNRIVSATYNGGYWHYAGDW